MHQAQAPPPGEKGAAAAATFQPLPAGAWGSLGEPLVLLILGSLGPDDLPAVHLVSRVWRDAARLSTQRLCFSKRPPDTERIKQCFPNVSELRLERMELTPHNMACVASLAHVTVLHLRMCHLKEGACLSALQGLPLQELHLCEVAGPSAEALDDALRHMTTLHTLKVESKSTACKAPGLRSLASLPRIRKLSVKQARPQHSLVGLTNLADLKELQALDLRRTGVTNSIMHRLAALTALTQLRVPEASLVTDQGFEALSGLTALLELDASCWATQADVAVSDHGAAHLRQLRQLTSLSLAGRTAVTAQGLGFLEAFFQLQHLDLSRVWLGSGDSAAFLWQLTQLTCLRIGGTKMPAAQFDGLSALGRLGELDASSTQFDDGCCRQLATLASLESINLAHTQVSNCGLQSINASHAGRLHQLRLDGCRVSMRGLLSALRCQPGGVCLWDGKLRDHMPRWVNVANTLLMVANGEGNRCLRLRYAPEPCWHQQAGMAGAVAGMLLGHALLLLGTMIVLMLLPVAGFCIAAVLLLAYAAGNKAAHKPVLRGIARGETVLSALLVGVLSIHVPPPPAEVRDWHW